MADERSKHIQFVDGFFNNILCSFPPSHVLYITVSIYTVYSKNGCFFIQRFVHIYEVIIWQHELLCISSFHFFKSLPLHNIYDTNADILCIYCKNSLSTILKPSMFFGTDIKKIYRLCEVMSLWYTASLDTTFYIYTTVECPPAII